MAILNDSNPFNKKSKVEELETLLDKLRSLCRGHEDKAEKV